ncbi:MULTISPECIES: rod shape-determining protein RodA [unclassified Azospirillum]|uniref:rod shape-determining protein RodA n=1 Tax=unclassified Azospirillum TaxID=2630922 RepID=UPI000B630529|nr:MULTISPECIES: rod shape-determining protein RodA [unclassified Azospirillum]SNS42062.1 cell elongation-specific peptidoglycan biosynthesis regulator RodA [Azospirillum sp. RU38E]SNS60724.1 cell elongation-specific peptidoglycan biosynthesis regulator RodA [Azospirillum sp. RU37A]
MSLDLSIDRGAMTIGEKLGQISWSLVFLITLVASIGFAMLYSAANGHFDPWASRQMLRFGVGLVVMLLIALIDIRLWMKLAYPLYGIVMVLLIGVDLFGNVGKGAQRWIDLGIIQLQPSEIMKVTLVMVLARYFHGATLEDSGRIPFLIPPLLLVGAPVALVLAQPNLGTSLMLIMAAGALFFLSGVRLWKFGLLIAAVIIAVPLTWQFVLHDYQRDRVETFLDPDSDPLGTGYHITQSKIAFGSGGLMGKGFLQGTQSHLNFLPEKQTDFIFTMLAEEFGLVGSLFFLFLYGLLLLYGFVIAGRCRHQFGKLLALGVTVNLFLYLFINVAMIMGLIPVVGVPLPLISYGGTATLGVMIGFGLLLSVHVHRDVRMSRRGMGDL